MQAGKESIKAGILIIGDEILSGDTLDTNSQFLAKRLNENGISLENKITCRDEEKEICDSLDYLFRKNEIVFSTGGLGPTSDDITKSTLAKYFNTELVKHEATFQYLEELYRTRKLKFTKLNQWQAYLPANAQILTNLQGTAPGMKLKKEGKILYSMPGVPDEMKHLMDVQVIPDIFKHFELKPLQSFTIKTAGVRESVLAELLEGVEEFLDENSKMAYLPSLGEVKLRLSSFHSDAASFESIKKKWSEFIEGKISKYIYGYGDDKLEKTLGKLLVKNKLTVSTAESCTGGYLAHKITSVPGSSRYFEGSIVSYSNAVKNQELGVLKETLESFGAVSEETVKEMALACRKKFKTDYALATSGIAGPDGGTEAKPVGTVWIGLAGPNDEVMTRKYIFLRDRFKNIHLSALLAMELLRRKILSYD